MKSQIHIAFHDSRLLNMNPPNTEISQMTLAKRLLKHCWGKWFFNLLPWQLYCQQLCRWNLNASISAHVNILPSTIALDALMPLSLTFTKKKWETPVKPKHSYVLSGNWNLFWKENYFVWIALEPWLNACPCMPQARVLKRALRGWRNFSPSGGSGKFCQGKFTYMVVGTLGGVILTIWTFFKAENNIL